MRTMGTWKPNWKPNRCQRSGPDFLTLLEYRIRQIHLNMIFVMVSAPVTLTVDVMFLDACYAPRTTVTTGWNAEYSECGVM